MTARVQTTKRTCECCGARFERRRFPSGRLEGVKRFADRRFCSRACFRKASADGYRVRPPGVWIVQPHQLKSAGATLIAPKSPSGLARPDSTRQGAGVAPSIAPGPLTANPLARISNPCQETS